MSDQQKKNNTFKVVYKSLLLILCVALPIIYFKAGLLPFVSTIAGALFLGALLLSWQITAGLMIREDPPGWTPIVIISRYALIGIGFYAIIHGRLVLWEWFVLGSVFIILAISSAAVFELLTKT